MSYDSTLENPKAAKSNVSTKASITRTGSSIDTTSSRTSGNSVDWYRDWPVTCAIMPSNQNPLPCYTNSLFHTVWKAGMTTKGRRHLSPLTIFRESALTEHVDGALLDGEIGRAGGCLDAQRHHQRPRRDAMGHRDGVRRQLTVPVADPGLHRGIALAARRRHGPLVTLACRENIGVRRLHLRQRRAFPIAVSDLAQPIVDGGIAGRQFYGARHHFHLRTAAAERACDECQRRPPAPIAGEQIGQNAAGGGRLLAAEIVERNVLRALQAALRVPLGFAMADVVDRRRGHGSLGLFLGAIPCSASCSAKYPAHPGASCRRRDSRNRRDAPRR